MAEPIVIHALKRKRSELAGHIDSLNRQLDEARASLVHVDATLILFGFDDSPSAIPAKNMARSSRLFGRGEVQRFVTDILRDNPQGLSTTEITKRLIEKKDFGQPDTVLMDKIKQRVSTDVNKLAREKRIRRGHIDDGTRIWFPMTCAAENSLSSPAKPDGSLQDPSSD